MNAIQLFLFPKTATCAVLEITSLERMDDSTEADIISNEPFWKQTKSCAAWLEAIAFLLIIPAVALQKCIQMRFRKIRIRIFVRILYILHIVFEWEHLIHHQDF